MEQFLVPAHKPCAMGVLDWDEYPAEQLTFIYEEEFNKLKIALLNGKCWDELKDQSLKVKELSIALYRKLPVKDISAPSIIQARES